MSHSLFKFSDCESNILNSAELKQDFEGNNKVKKQRATERKKFREENKKLVKKTKLERSLNFNDTIHKELKTKIQDLCKTIWSKIKFNEKPNITDPAILDRHFELAVNHIINDEDKTFLKNATSEDLEYIIKDAIIFEY